MRRRIGEGAPAGIVGIQSAVGEKLGRERPSRAALARARWPGEEVRVDGRSQRGGERSPRGGLILGCVAQGFREFGRGRHFSM